MELPRSAGSPAERWGYQKRMKKGPKREGGGGEKERQLLLRRVHCRQGVRAETSTCLVEGGNTGDKFEPRTTCTEDNLAFLLRQQHN